MAEETTGVRITQQAIYAKQLEHGETLVKILEKLDHLDEVPARLREVELTLAQEVYHFLNALRGGFYMI